jgi:hypothetical protein
VVRSFGGRCRGRPLESQLPQYPHAKAAGLLRFLFRLGLGFVTTRDVIVLTCPALVVATAGSPAHPSSMTDGQVWEAGGPTPPTRWWAPSSQLAVKFAPGALTVGDTVSESEFGVKVSPESVGVTM